MFSTYMSGILADINAIKEVDTLMHYARMEWNDLLLGLQVFSFSDLGLDLKANDTMVWQTCQSLRILLLTNNRNHDGPTSLEETIRTLNNETCLPVFTFGNGNTFRSNSNYARRAAKDFVEYLLEIENYLGVGRIYLPRTAE